MMRRSGKISTPAYRIAPGPVWQQHAQPQRQNVGEDRLEAGRERMRPILMTASTTIIGLLPLALGGSRVGGLFYFPLAITVMESSRSMARFAICASCVSFTCAHIEVFLARIQTRIRIRI